MKIKVTKRHFPDICKILKQREKNEEVYKKANLQISEKTLLYTI